MKLKAPSKQVAAVQAAPVLDPSQRAVLAAVLGPDAAPTTLVLGAPGTGKTTVAIELVSAAVDQGMDPAKILVLSATRRSAGQLRDTVAARIEGPVRGAIVRTAPAAAFGILTAAATAAGEPPPRLITGPEQDHLLAQVLAGHLEGLVPAINWPVSIPEDALGLRGFRAELRDLLMRAAENGLGPQQLAALGQRHDRPDWVAAAQLLREYDAITTLAAVTPDAGHRYDPAQIVDEATYALAQWQGPDRPGWDLVVVDDYQEVTAAVARFLGLLRRDGARLVLLADPDIAVQGFRGGQPTLVGRAGAGSADRIHLDAERLGEFGAGRLVLETVWRSGANLRAVTTAVTQTVATVGETRHRRAVSHPREVTGTVEAVVTATEAQNDTAVANILRSESLRNQTPWSAMAVVCRSGGDLARLRRTLAAAGVPVAVTGADIALRDEPAVRPLLTALMGAAKPELELDTALDLLTSPIGGLDGIGLRRLRRQLRTLELAAGGVRNSDALLVAALEAPGAGPALTGIEGQALARVARVVTAGRVALEVDGASAQTALWAVWDASGLGPVWQESAVRGGAGGIRADRDLDAVMSLFRAAEFYVDRMPQSHPLSFVEFLLAQDLPADSLASGASTTEVVSLVTPAGAAGQEWDVVVVAGVQDGTWPDLRLRDSLLGSQALVELLSGRSQDARGLGPEARKAVLFDELRAFALATSRARRRLVVTATDNDEEQPSVFFDLVTGVEGVVRATQDRRVHEAPLTLRGLVALLRAELQGAIRSGLDDRATERARLLAYLADHGVVEADPVNWYGAHDISTSNVLAQPQDTVHISPSKLESVHTCALRWVLESAGGQPAAGLSQSVGTLIHEVAACFPSGSLTELSKELDDRWAGLNLPDGWPSRRLRQNAQGMLVKLADYYRSAERAGVLRVEVEQSFTYTVGDAVVAGSADRVEFLGDGTVRIVDLKTGKNAPTIADTLENPQLGAYQLAALTGALGADAAAPAGASLLYVATATKTPTIREQPAITDPEDNFARALIDRAAEVMRSNCFTAQINPMCQNCPVRRSCPLQTEGQQVVELTQPDSTRPEHTQGDPVA